MSQTTYDIQKRRATLKFNILEFEQKNRIAVDSFRLLGNKKLNVSKLNERLIRIDKKFGPIYYQTHNTKAAETNRTIAIQPGGELGLNLDG